MKAVKTNPYTIDIGSLTEEILDEHKKMQALTVESDLDSLFRLLSNFKTYFLRGGKVKYKDLIVCMDTKTKKRLTKGVIYNLSILANVNPDLFEETGFPRAAFGGHLYRYPEGLVPENSYLGIQISKEIFKDLSSRKDKQKIQVEHNDDICRPTAYSKSYTIK